MVTGKKINAVFLPVIDNFSQLLELYYKIAWLSFPLTNQIMSISFPVKSDLLENIDQYNKESIYPEHLDPALTDLPDEVFEKFLLINGDDEELMLNMIEKSDVIFDWENDAYKKYAGQNEKIAAVTAGKERINADKYKIAHDTWQYQSYFTRNDSEYESILDESLENFNELKSIIKENNYERAYVFGTGPSLKYVPQIDLSDGMSIVSNGIILNKELMSYIKPLVATGIDPLYHSGPSVYCGQFRKMLAEAIEEYGTYFITRIEFYRWFADYFPVKLRNKIIGIPVILQKGIPVLNGDKNVEGGFNLFNGNGNVLNASLLPLGLSFCKEVNILGCDGRPPADIRTKENIKYFWRHDDKSQINNWESIMYKAAPFYFESRDFDKYFDSHTQYTTELIEYAESNGWNIRGRTPSYLPVLSKLYSVEKQFEQN